MKFALALATLALVAANPVPKSPIQQRDDGLAYNNEGVAKFPQATPGDCNTADANCCCESHQFQANGSVGQGLV